MYSRYCYGKIKIAYQRGRCAGRYRSSQRNFQSFRSYDEVEVFINDGTEVEPGDVAMLVEGKVQSLLQTERLMLNVMQRMSGIATMTRKYAKKLEGTRTHVLDTRKTTPGMRILEKWQ